MRIMHIVLGFALAGCSAVGLQCPKGDVLIKPSDPVVEQVDGIHKQKTPMECVKT